MSKQDYYAVLGLSKDAGDRQISSAYRKLAVKYHPDNNPNDDEATLKFKEAAEAYEVLSDPEKRSRYDRFGHSGVEGSGSGFGNAKDIFDAFSDIFGGGVFNNFFGGGGGHEGRRVRKGADVRVDVTLTLEEAATGIDHTFEVPRSEKCNTCEGSGCKPGTKPSMCVTCGGLGQVVQSHGILRVQTTCPECRGEGKHVDEPCADCRGAGFIKKKVDIEVSIPAGVDDETRVRIPGQGEPSPDGGPPGHCYCFVSVREHHLFQREGSHLSLRMPIAYTQAALGATIQIPTLAGPEDYQIPAGTQAGEVIRLRGKGITDPHSGRKGDLHVQFNIETPRKVSAKQEGLLRELAELEEIDVTPKRKSFLDSIKDYFTANSTD
ncbi:MAG: molecular chaperone DnaJ [Planctomycetota bacterium]|nr:molecular chaperone DnaJ [Planctomycetota bacterium]